MKSKRLLSCALALAMTLSLAAAPASAATTAFPDVQTHWAKSYIEEMTAANMFKGYEDGTFRPEGKLTTAEALTLCARAVGLDENTGAKIADDWKEDVKSVLEGNLSWFYRECAICLETGILSYTDLKNLYKAGALTKPIEKEDLSVYLVRAMQLGPMAERLSAYDMNFTDTGDISTANQPYVYLLNIYGIVQGDQNNAFGPQGEVTRAIMATMLSRSLNFMEENGVSPDLPEYTTYDFRQGTIAAVSSGNNGITLLTLNNDLTGATDLSVSLPSDVAVYENNMKTGTNALKAGRHVRVVLDNKGVATAVRVSDALEAFTGTVNGIDGNELAITTGGTGMILDMDRFTQVMVGGKTVGDRTIVDPDAGYTSVTCKLDDQGRLVAAQFTGGTRLEEGIFSSVDKAVGSGTVNTIHYTGFDGVSRSISMPTGGSVTVNGVADSLKGNHEGCYIALRVSNDDGTAITAAVDTVTKYVQGAIKGVGYASDTKTLTIMDLSTNKNATYNVAVNAEIRYNGEETILRSLEKDYFVTARISGGTLALIDAYPGSTVTEGVITNRTFGTGNDSTTVTIQVTQENEAVVSYTLSLADPPTVKRNDEKTTLDKLRVGDQVVVTVRYNAVTSIEATPQSANVTGTIDSILLTKTGYTLDMTLTTGEEVSYTVSSATPVTQSGKDVALSTLQPGHKLAMVVNGDQVVSIEIQQAGTTAGQIEGTVINVDTKAKTVLLRVEDSLGNEQLVTVDARDATILQANGKEIALRELGVGDLLEVKGNYESSTEFTATIIIR